MVDDEPVSRKVAALLLAQQGWSVATVASGSEALARLEAGARYDAILLDLEIPGLDGLETARALVLRSPTGARPWLVLQTAGVTDAVRARARAVGILDVLAKPLCSESLERFSARARRHRRLEDERALRSLEQAAATDDATALLGSIADAVIFGEADVARAKLAELRAVAQRRQLARVDARCSALEAALVVGSEGLEALADLEHAVGLDTREPNARARGG